jgi:DNA topoisomerase IB
MARLRRVDCSGPGIRRRPRGKGFEYLDDEGRRITEPSMIERIRELAIPPAWEDVWICPYPLGHIQATGTDAAGRKQYRYHDLWRARRDREKFDEMIEFARALPRLRRRVSKDLKRPGVPCERVLAYVKEAAGGDFSAKDFRTWSGTVLAAVAISVSGMATTSKSARKRAKTRAVKEVARYLGNTPAVCRASYIDPRVFDRFDGGLTISGALPELMEDTAAWPDVQRAVEEAVLDLIANDRESEAVEPVRELRDGLAEVAA